MRALVLLAALSTSAPIPAEEQGAETALCLAANTAPERRIVACTRVVAASGIDRVGLAKAYYARGRAHADSGRHAQAIADFDDAIRLDPDHTNALHDRGRAREAVGDDRRALRDYGRALALTPEFAAALNSMAWLLATVADDTLRDGVEAVRLATRALRLVGYPEHHGTLAASYAAAGQFAAAVKAQETAIARLQATGRVLLIPEYRARLTLYRAGQPFLR